MTQIMDRLSHHVKPSCPFPARNGVRDNMSMPKKKRNTRVPPLWAKAFQARTRTLRMGAQMSQGEIAKALGVSRETYAKYENRSGSLLPHHLIHRFVMVTGGPKGYEFLLSGHFTAPDQVGVAEGNEETSA